MVCPYRQAVNPECYGNDCPYYIYSGRCAAIEKELAE